MNRFVRPARNATAALIVLLAASEPSVAASRIEWGDLRPATQAADATIKSAAASATGETLSLGLSGTPIELAGYLLPVDREGDLVYEFMLVPWPGACVHVPPPPPNQLVLVTPDKPYRTSEIYEPVSISGTLRPAIEKRQFFMMDGIAVVEAGYSVHHAEVAKAASIPNPTPAPKTPWDFLKK